MEPRRYHVLAPLGRGGFATVYRAEMLGSDGFRKLVALKVLHPEVMADAEAAARFRDEARLLGLLRHTGIVRVDGLLRLGGRQVLVEEYVDGVDLSALLTTGPLPVRPALEIAAAAARALDYAHSRCDADGRPLGVLHRDLKPSNLRLSAAGELKILDFGVAHAEFPGREAETRLRRYGTRAYLAPERLEGKDTAAGDVYALGAVLFELITGDPPCGRAPRLGAPARVVPAELWARLQAHARAALPLVEAMLDESPDQRPSAREVWLQMDALVPAIPGPTLYAWAETAVPTAQRSGEGGGVDALTGSTLSEEMTPGPSQPVAPARRRKRWPVLGVLVLALGALAVPGDPDSEATPAPPPGPVVVSTTALAPRATPPPIPTAPGPVEATPRPAPRAARPPATPTGAILVTGDAPLEIQFEANGQTWSGGLLPVGSYRILARFSAEDLLRPAGSVVVSKDAVSTLVCSAGRRSCH